VTDTKVVLVNGYDQGLNERILELAPPGFSVTAVDNGVSDDEKRAALADSEFVMGLGASFAAEVLWGAPKLKLIQLLHAGYDSMDMGPPTTLGIPVANCGDANAATVAEHTIALLLAVLRKLVRADAAFRDGADLRNHSAFDIYSYGDLFERRVGIIGMGNSGRRVARCLRGFDCTLRYATPRPLARQDELDLEIEHVSLDLLLESSDVVTLHVPLTHETRHLIGRAELARMKSSAILVNTTRGAVVDERALIEALRDGQIGGAGLDVFDPEPPAPDNPLLSFDNVVVTPHVAGGSGASLSRIFAFGWQNIVDVRDGKKPRAVVNDLS